MKFLKIILLFLSILIVVFLPMTLMKSYEFTNILIKMNTFNKIKISIDSLQIERFVYADGTVSSPFYIVHNDSLGLSLTIRDSDGLLGDKGHNQLEKHFEEYIIHNNDSIWIWYTSSLPPLYAKGKDDILSYERILFPFFLNTFLSFVGVYLIIWQIRRWIKG